MRSAAVLAFALAAAGCSSNPMPNDPGIVCTAIAVSALNVTVRDLASGAAICDATVLALPDGGPSYPLRQTGACTYAGAEERDGGFTVLVIAPGYKTARASGIHVGRDECHVIPVQLTVALEICPRAGCNPS